MRLKGKIALITAAASGIGRAAAVLFVREGASVAVADIDKGRDRVTRWPRSKGAGGRGHGIPCDLTRDADSRRIVREAVDALGGLDILWNNVGHPGPGRVMGRPDVEANKHENLARMKQAPLGRVGTPARSGPRRPFPGLRRGQLHHGRITPRRRRLHGKVETAAAARSARNRIARPGRPERMASPARAAPTVPDPCDPATRPAGSRRAAPGGGHGVPCLGPPRPRVSASLAIGTQM